MMQRQRYDGAITLTLITEREGISVSKTTNASLQTYTCMHANVFIYVVNSNQAHWVELRSMDMSECSLSMNCIHVRACNTSTSPLEPEAQSIMPIVVFMQFYGFDVEQWQGSKVWA